MAMPVESQTPVRPQRSFWYINRPLLTLKILLILFYGGMICLLPLLTVHLKSLGVTVTEASYIQGILPALRFAGPVIAGLVADRGGNYRAVLAILLVLTCVFHTLLLWVPPYGVRQINYAAALADNNTLACLTHHRELSYNLDNRIDTVLNDEDERLLNCSYTESVPEAVQHQQRACRAKAWCTSMDSFNGTVCTVDAATCTPTQIISTNSTHAHAQHQVFHLTEQLGVALSAVCVRIPTTHSSSIANISCTEQMPFGDRWHTLIMYTAIRTMSTILMGADFTLIDATTFQMPLEHGGDFGWNKLFGTVASCAMAPLSGWLIDWHNKDRKLNAISGTFITDYSPAFYIFNIMMLLAALVTIFSLSLSIRKPRKKVIGGVATLLRTPNIFLFVSAVCVLGMCWGFIDGFLYWFLKDLGASTWFQQSTQTVGGLAGIPATAFSSPIIRAVGHMNIIIAAIAVYGVRMIGVSIVTATTYGYVMFFEAMEALTTHLVWISVIQYCGISAPDLAASLQGIAGGLHFGPAKGLGTFIGGHMYANFGAPKAYQLFGVGSIVAGVIYAITYYLFIRNREQAVRRANASMQQQQPTADDDAEQHMLPFPDTTLTSEFGAANDANRAQAIELAETPSTPAHPLPNAK